MPASATTNATLPTTQPHRPIVSHVNMQLDSFVANVTPDELRAIVRCLLATGPAGTTGAFTKIAKQRTKTELARPRKATKAVQLFTADAEGNGVPLPALQDTLSRVKSIAGVGLGFDSLPILCNIIANVHGLHYEEESEMEEALCQIDGDIAQTIQSCREQVAAGDVKDSASARAALTTLREALEDYREEVEAWGGEFLLEKGILALDGWKF